MKDVEHLAGALCTHSRPSPSLRSFDKRPLSVERFYLARVSVRTHARTLSRAHASTNTNAIILMRVSLTRFWQPPASRSLLLTHTLLLHIFGQRNSSRTQASHC